MISFLYLGAKKKNKKKNKNANKPKEPTPQGNGQADKVEDDNSDGEVGQVGASSLSGRAFRDNVANRRDRGP